MNKELPSLALGSTVTISLRIENALSSSSARMSFSALMCTHMQDASNSEPPVISCVAIICALWVALIELQVNLLFVVDELIDEQDGKDALATGNIFLNAMRDDTWDDLSMFSKMTKEFVLTFP
jgi:hypothetical protein